MRQRNHQRIHRHPPSRERRLAQLAALACLAGAAAAVPLARGEWRTEGIIAAMRSGDASARGAVLERFADTPSGSLPTPGEAALAQIALTSASETQDPALRQLYLARARDLAAHLRATRGDWAPSLILSAEAAIALAGPARAIPPQALRDYAASYRAAPFLWQEAHWRIALGGLAWPALDRATRQHMIDEAVWLTRYDQAQQAGIEADLGDSPAAVAYQLQLSRSQSSRAEAGVL
jgi:hypothetical protein